MSCDRSLSWPESEDGLLRSCDDACCLLRSPWFNWSWFDMVLLEPLLLLSWVGMCVLPPVCCPLADEWDATRSRVNLPLSPRDQLNNAVHRHEAIGTATSWR